MTAANLSYVAKKDVLAQLIYSIQHPQHARQQHPHQHHEPSKPAPHTHFGSVGSQLAQQYSSMLCFPRFTLLWNYLTAPQPGGSAGLVPQTVACCSQD